VNSLPAFARSQQKDFASVGHRLWSALPNRSPGCLPLVNAIWDGPENGAPEGFRTPNRQIRSLVLYPLSYRRLAARQPIAFWQ
jgi:hypothetical protein